MDLPKAARYSGWLLLFLANVAWQTTCLSSEGKFFDADSAGLANASTSSHSHHEILDPDSERRRTDDGNAKSFLQDYVTLSEFQQQPALVPRTEVQPSIELPAPAQETFASLFGEVGIPRSFLFPGSLAKAPNPGADIILGKQSQTRVTTDAGDLLGRSPAALGLGVQRRNPIINETRVRGSRVGSLAASGSYWIPARIDLDTMLSKIDSRIVQKIEVIPGPYSALNGPQFDFVEFELFPAPRYTDGCQNYGQTAVDYKTNGEGWYGRQSLWGGDADWGYRVGYGHRTGNDYTSGSGISMPTSYNSRVVDAAIGANLTRNDALDFNYLRVDQTNVELPGQAFDIDLLATNGYSATHESLDNRFGDRVVINTWYNCTRLEGSAQRPSKRREFPFYDFINFIGNTDVDSMSTGFRVASTLGTPDTRHITVGTDLRYVRQQLNEITSGRLGFNVWSDANSPIPLSHISNPGLFLEIGSPNDQPLVIRTGARVDWAGADIDEDLANLSAIGIAQPQSSLAAILGSDEFNQNFLLWSAFVAADYRMNRRVTIGTSFGFGQRPPNLTELYAAQPFMFLLQNGLNTVTGDPLLEQERLLQCDLRLLYNAGSLRAGVRGFYGWLHDYITFENLSIQRGPPVGDVVQTNLKFVNTDSAILVGGDAYVEWDANSWVTPFGLVTYVEGTDRTRNGSFATRQAVPGIPSERVPGLPRGYFSGIHGASQEPLPGILPLESRLGFRFHPPRTESPWEVELSARVVASQDRVAASLLESPTPGFTVWDLRGYWRPKDKLLLVAGIENLTDKNYREHLDYRTPHGFVMLQPGISFYFGSELTY